MDSSSLDPVLSPPKKSRWRWFWAALLLAIAVPAIYLLNLPYVPALRTTNPSTTTVMELREKQAREAGHPIRTKYHWRNLKAISPNLVHAVLLSEDDVFYEHHGFDIEQIRAAIKLDWEKRRYAYGGSTITQQLARSLYLSPRKNMLRKAKEALITFLLERYLSKDRIMELYLNVVEWGPGVYGAEAAAQTYFQKPAVDLTPDEAVALASILPSPRKWSPTSERSFMARRRTRLYARMRQAGFIPADVSTEMTVPDEIQRLAAQANDFLQQQEAEENSFGVSTSTDTEPTTTNSNDGLIAPTHSAAPQ
jgi:monofunctional glycosyltransferase